MASKFYKGRENRIMANAFNEAAYNTIVDDIERSVIGDSESCASIASNEAQRFLHRIDEALGDLSGRIRQQQFNGLIYRLWMLLETDDVKEAAATAQSIVKVFSDGKERWPKLTPCYNWQQDFAESGSEMLDRSDAIEGVETKAFLKQFGLDCFRVANIVGGSLCYGCDPNEECIVEAFVSRGWADEGIALYESMIETNPSNICEIVRAAANLSFAKGDFAKVVELCDDGEYAADDSYDIEKFVVLSTKANLKLGDEEAAKTHLERILTDERIAEVLHDDTAAWARDTLDRLNKKAD